MTIPGAELSEDTKWWPSNGDYPITYLFSERSKRELSVNR